METIQVVLDSSLLRAADTAAHRARVNRSALIRMALREHLKRLKTLEMEARDHEGYRRRNGKPGEVARWERVAAWPEP